MKKIILLTLTFISIAVQAQWKQSFPGQTSLMRNLSVLNDQSIWAMDQTKAGTSVSLNGGNTWSFFPMDLTMKANYVGGFHALNDSVAFTVVADGTAKGTYKTSNRGQTWKKLSNGFNDCSAFPDLVYFFNDKDGVAIGDGVGSLILEIMITRDGGDLWSTIPDTHLPKGSDWTVATNNILRQRGDTLFLMGGSGRIYKTVDKGLNWTSFQTPVNSIGNVYFDFKDSQHGLLSTVNPTTKVGKLWRTNNSGLNWDSIPTTNYYNMIKYVPTMGAYLSTSTQLGLSYSMDNGTTWTKHPSFDKVGVEPVLSTSGGKIFMGGWGTIYSSTNPLGINPSVTSVAVTGSKTLDVLFSEAMDLVSSQDTSKYTVSYLESGIQNKLNIKSAVQNLSNPMLVQLTMDADLPLDTLRINVRSVFDSRGPVNGFPVINNSSTSIRTLLPTAVAVASMPTVQMMVDKNATLQVSAAIDMDVLEIFDAAGKMVVRQKFENKPVQLRSLKAGMYLLRLSGKEGVKTLEYIRN